MKNYTRKQNTDFSSCFYSITLKSPYRNGRGFFKKIKSLQNY
nr:MAG TPA: hypothetical protein [Caudoviricetes sp.]